ncbi:MAG: cytochrome-c oxidase, cbb3-type subunit III [Hyphomicrobium sp.]
MTERPEIDDVTGVETTGHVWDDDIRELNKPLPKWWLYTFYVTIVWAIGYWIVYPAWPTINGYTRGMLGYSQRAAVVSQVKAAGDAQASLRQALISTPLEKIKDSDDLSHFAAASGKSTFQANCAPCHGRGAQGSSGYPNLNDDEWLWGGSLEAIYMSIQHGVRNADGESRAISMPRFGVDKLLEPGQIADTAEYVLSLSGKSNDQSAAARGKTIFTEQCVSCHQEDGHGNQEFGAPNLTNAIWLYGSEKQQIIESITTGRGGKMPAWSPRLDDASIRALAVYVHGLGGGQ